MKKSMVKFFIFALVFLTALGAAEVKPKYIFLFIGDGMSIPQRIAADESSRSAYGKPLTPEDTSL